LQKSQSNPDGFVIEVMACFDRAAHKVREEDLLHALLGRGTY
jgi:hypothetical protein